MSRESVFENMETGFFSWEILQEPEVRDTWYYTAFLSADGKK